MWHTEMLTFLHLCIYYVQNFAQIAGLFGLGHDQGYNNLAGLSQMLTENIYEFCMLNYSTGGCMPMIFQAAILYLYHNARAHSI
jgi:hypothetical protein